MKLFAILCMGLLVMAVVLTSGCTQQPAGGDNQPSGPSVNLEEQSYQLVDEELSNVVDNISLGDLENSLLEQ